MQLFIWKKKILRDYALGIKIEESNNEERNAEIGKLRKRREERVVHKEQQDKEAKACAWTCAQMDYSEPKGEEEKKDGSMLIAIVKEQQRRIQEVMG